MVYASVPQGYAIASTNVFPDAHLLFMQSKSPSMVSLFHKKRRYFIRAHIQIYINVWSCFILIQSIKVNFVYTNCGSPEFQTNVFHLQSPLNSRCWRAITPLSKGTLPKWEALLFMSAVPFGNSCFPCGRKLGLIAPNILWNFSLFRDWIQPTWEPFCCSVHYPLPRIPKRGSLRNFGYAKIRRLFYWTQYSKKFLTFKLKRELALVLYK